MVEVEKRGLENSRASQERIREDIATAKKVYYEYIGKINDLLPVLKANKQVMLLFLNFACLESNRGRVDRACASETVDSISIPGRVKLKTIKTDIHSFPA